MRFDQQVDNALNYVLPFIEKTANIQTGTRVLEIGCGEGGVLKPFVDKGCICLGVDLDQLRIDLAQDFYDKTSRLGKLPSSTKMCMMNPLLKNIKTILI